MILKVLTLGAIALLLLLHVSRSSAGARLLGVSLQVLNIVYLAALVLTGALAAHFEQWMLLAVVVILLLVSLVEEMRQRRRLRDEAGRRPAQRAQR